MNRTMPLLIAASMVMPVFASAEEAGLPLPAEIERFLAAAPCRALLRPDDPPALALDRLSRAAAERLALGEAVVGCGAIEAKRTSAAARSLRERLSESSSLDATRESEKQRPAAPRPFGSVSLIYQRHLAAVESAGASGAQVGLSIPGFPARAGSVEAQVGFTAGYGNSSAQIGAITGESRKTLEAELLSGRYGDWHVERTLKEGNDGVRQTPVLDFSYLAPQRRVTPFGGVGWSRYTIGEINRVAAVTEHWQTTESCASITVPSSVCGQRIGTNGLGGQPIYATESTTDHTRNHSREETILRPEQSGWVPGWHVGTRIFLKEGYFDDYDGRPGKTSIGLLLRYRQPITAKRELKGRSIEGGMVIGF